MDPYRLYQILYGTAAASALGGLGAAGYGTYRAGKGVYNAMKRPGKVQRARGRYMLKGCRKTRSYTRSSVSQKTITAPVSRVIDTKYNDVASTFTGLKNSASLDFGGNVVNGGSNEGQRVGNDIRVIKYILTLEIKHGSDQLDHTYRLIGVRHKTGASHANPTIQAILNPDANSNYTPLSLRNVLNIEDFEILIDRTFVVPNSSASNHGLTVKNFQIDTCFPQRYSSTASADLVRNPVWWFLLTNVTNTTTGCSGQFIRRMMYSDI